MANNTFLLCIKNIKNFYSIDIFTIILLKMNRFYLKHVILIEYFVQKLIERLFFVT